MYDNIKMDLMGISEGVGLVHLVEDTDK